MTGRLIAAGCCTLLVACTSVPAWERLPPSPVALSVQAGKIGEECFVLAAGERIEYQFEASAPVAFNLHTHRGREIVMPVQVENTREQAGAFTSPQREEYCMMWTNRGAAATRVTGEWRRLR